MISPYNCTTKHKQRYGLVIRSDPEKGRLSKTQYFMESRRTHTHTTYEIWTDDSLFNAPERYLLAFEHEERVCVKWDDGWYYGSMMLHPTTGAPMSLFTILCDDGDVFRYQLSRRISRTSFEIVDEDRDLQVLHR